MTSIVEYSKNIMDELNALNNKKKAEESQHCFIIIFNIDSKQFIPVECGDIVLVAAIYFSIVMGLEEFPDFKTVHEKQEYELRLDSQQIERIIAKYDEEMINVNLKNEDSLFLNSIQPLLNFLKESLEDVE